MKTRRRKNSVCSGPFDFNGRALNDFIPSLDDGLPLALTRSIITRGRALLMRSTFPHAALRQGQAYILLGQLYLK